MFIRITSHLFLRRQPESSLCIAKRGGTQRLAFCPSSLRFWTNQARLQLEPLRFDETLHSFRKSRTPSRPPRRGPPTRQQGQHSSPVQPFDPRWRYSVQLRNILHLLLRKHQHRRLGWASGPFYGTLEHKWPLIGWLLASLIDCACAHLVAWLGGRLLRWLVGCCIG